MKNGSFAKAVLFGSALGAVLLVTGSAAAEVKRIETRDQDSVYEFRDDLLNSDVAFPGGGSIVVRPGAARATLIRPRTSFVLELFKSTEHL